MADGGFYCGRSKQIGVPGTTPRVYRSKAQMLAELRRSIAVSLPGNGANNSTAFTDNTGKVWTRSSTPVISTAQSPFAGSSSMFFSGGTQYVSTPFDPDFFHGYRAFQISLWVYFSSASSDMDFLAHRNTGDPSNFWGMRRTSGNRIRWFVRTNGSTFYDNTGTTAISASTWYHVIAGRTDAGLFFTAVNGAIDASQAIGTSQLLRCTDNPLILGCGDNSGSGGLSGYVRDLQIIRGNCPSRGLGSPNPHGELAY